MNFRTVVLLAVAATSASAQRVSFPNFTGPGAAGARNQIVGALCDRADCVAANRTTTGGKPDWKKAKKESVLFFVTAKVIKKGKAFSLDLQVLNKAGPAKARKTFALDKNGTLSPQGLQQVVDLLSSAFGGSTQRAPEPTPTPEVEKATPKAPPKPADQPPTSTTRRAPEPAPEPEARGTPAAPTPGKVTSKFLMIDVGADLLTRRLEYSQVATSNLRRYDLGLTGVAALGVKFFPLALVRDDLLAGLGAEFEIGFAPWIQSQLASAAAFPTSAMRIDGGIRWDLRPIKTYALAISPYVGVRSQSFTVSPVMGQRIDGLPNIAQFGFRAGLGLDLPILENRLSVFGRFGIIPVFSSGEIISSAFFANGSAFGFEANGGVAVGVLAFMQVRASFEFARYGMTFITQPTDTYVAAGAAETYLGGNASLRFMF